MWNSSPGRISYLAVLLSQISPWPDTPRASVEPWEEDNAARIAGGFGIGDLEEVTVVKPFVARVASSMGCCGLAVCGGPVK